MKIQSRIQVEDFVHDVIAMALPNIDKSDIRPAYQKTKQPIPAGRNFLTQDGEENGLVGYTNEDEFVYFYVDTSLPEENSSEVTADNKVTIIRNYPVTVYCYGKNSSTNAVILKALLRSIHIQHYMNFNDYYLYTEGTITPIMDNYNGEWYERNDVTFVLTSKADIETEKEDAPVLSNGADITVIIDGEERL